MAARLLGAEELRECLKRLMGYHVDAWKDVDAIKDHVAALDADNAALLAFVREIAGGAKDGLCMWCGNVDANHRERCAPAALLAQPHSGAALLEEHRKALVRVGRLEGTLNRLAETAWNVSQDDKMVIRTAGVLQRSVVEIHGLLTTRCEDGSCVKCRSGEPCR